MSIYATLWTLRFPAEGDDFIGCDWVEVIAQGAPPHIGTPTPDQGYEEGDPYAGFLPPAVETDAEGWNAVMRAVVFVTAGTPKGTERSPQEYVRPLLVLTGREYAEIRFDDLHRRLCDALRGDRARVVMQFVGPDGRVRTIREDGSSSERMPPRPEVGPMD